jgi:hypothetical protein
LEPVAEIFVPPQAPEEGLQAAPRSYRLELPLSREDAHEFVARLLGKKATLDPFLTETGVELILDFGSGDELTGFNQGESVFSLVGEALTETLRQKSEAPKISFKWLQEGLPQSFTMGNYLGPIRLKHPGTGSDGTFNFGPVISLPSPVYLSPRKQAELSLAVMALHDFLNPPLGAPETKGQETLILSEGTPLMPLVARKFGSGDLSFAFSHKSTGENLRSLLDNNPEIDGITPYESSLPALMNRYKEDFQDKFALIVVAISPYLVNRHIKTLASWLKVTGRLVLPSILGSQQTAMNQKAALKSGLVLLGSIYESDQVMLTFQRPKPRDVQIWEWEPGDWVKELNEEDKLILERIAAGKGTSVYEDAVDHMENDIVLEELANTLDIDELGTDLILESQDTTEELESQEQADDANIELVIKESLTEGKRKRGRRAKKSNMATDYSEPLVAGEETVTLQAETKISEDSMEEALSHDPSKENGEGVNADGDSSD